ncbi:hypothetical protein C1645_763566 [Glomus cerebriforme]|uniref:Uncharacterized protein n=1 Tax=Glomus cerebriforme TaxID=658196 RepID=A0A397T9W0_9GLOM|nr:hypothetical protein C1645_763566 [Glomus cerebriforme]
MKNFTNNPTTDISNNNRLNSNCFPVSRNTTNMPQQPKQFYPPNAWQVYPPQNPSNTFGPNNFDIYDYAPHAACDNNSANSDQQFYSTFSQQQYIQQQCIQRSQIIII